jgi:hypothetical protein
MADESIDIDLLFVSDAGATFDWEIKRRYWWVYPRTVRATNILMKRLTEATVKALGSIGTKTALFSICDVVPEQKFEGVLPPDLQQRMPDVRTDLDKFDTVAGLLTRHGYEVAFSHLLDRSDIDVDLSQASAKGNPPESWDGRSVRLASKLLEHAQRLRVAGLFNMADWAAYALVGKAALIALICYLPLYFQKKALLQDAEQQQEAMLRHVATPVKIEPGTTRTIRITGALTNDAPETQAISQPSFNSVNIQFVNQSSEPVVLYWIDFNGKAEKKGQMEPGQILTFSGFSGHLWIAKTTAGKELLRYTVR